MLLAQQINGTTNGKTCTVGPTIENCAFLRPSDEWIFLGCDAPQEEL